MKTNSEFRSQNLEAASRKISAFKFQLSAFPRARARGNICVDGLGMLLHQGRLGFKAWFGADPQVSDEQRKQVLAA